MDDVQALPLSLPLVDWASIIGALWSATLLHPERLEVDGRLGSRLYVEYVRALGFDSEQLADGLLGLPEAVR